MVLAQLDPEGIGEVPFGRVVLTIVDASGHYTNIDLGENEEMDAQDLFRTAHGSDIDLDGVVTERDLEIVLEDMASGYWHPRGDVDLDGLATEADLAIVAENMSH